MQAVQFSRLGEPKDVLSVVRVPKPKPDDGQVLLRIVARPINPSDCFFIRGQYGWKPRLPAVPGFECVGVVDELGPNVSRPAPGQRVVALASGGEGTWQEYMVAPADTCIVVPDDIPDAKAAQLVVNPLSAVLMLEELDPKKGEWVLQNAANSSVGILTIQLAKLRGAKTINVIRRRADADYVRSKGGDEVICTEDEDIVKRVREITRGKGAPYAIDAIGGKSGSDIVKSMAQGGKMVVYGWMSMQDLSLNNGLLIFKGITIKGFWLSTFLARTDPKHVQRMFDSVLALLRAGKIDPPLGREFDLAHVRDAVQHAESAGKNGKTLLVSKL